jgi:hypothetical protein
MSRMPAVLPVLGAVDGDEAVGWSKIGPEYALVLPAALAPAVNAVAMRANDTTARANL